MKNFEKLRCIILICVFACTLCFLVSCNIGQDEEQTDIICLSSGDFNADNSATITVSEYTDIFSFEDNIVINSNYSYTVYADASYDEKSIINSKYDGLSYGKNNYYIQAKNKNDNTIMNYSLCVIREKYLSVTFVFGDDTENITTSVLYGETFTPPEREPANIAGHLCKGWNYSTLPVTEDLTVGGIYEMIPYTCTFDYNYDSRNSIQTAYYGIFLPLETPFREGYEFDGWYYNGEKVEHPFMYLFEENITLIAEWKEISR